MKKIYIPLGLSIAAVLLVFGFLSCSNQLTNPLPVSDPDNPATQAGVYNDSSRAVAVYVDPSGNETLIESEEDSVLVKCVEYTDFINLDADNTAARNVRYGKSLFKAIILGKRSDGNPGLWIVYGDGRVTPVINSENLDTSKLLDIAEVRQPVSAYFGWTYTALEMAANSDASQIVIMGYAENKYGVDYPFYEVKAGTTVGVYWAVFLDDEGLYHISRAKVIGLKDTSWLKDYHKYFNRKDLRRRLRWMWTLRRFFYGWYDTYLTMPSKIETAENGGEFKIYGTDQDGDDALAVVTVKRVLSIEQWTPPVEENHPPYAVNGPFTAKEYTVGTGVQTFQLTIAEQSGLKDPDGDTVYFRSSALPAWITLDEKTGIVTVDTQNLHSAEVLSFWSEDEHGADTSSSPFEITISVNPDTTVQTNKLVFSSDRDGDFEIYSLDLDTNVVTQLTSNTATDKQPDISADGTKIVFVSDRSGSWEIYTMDADGSNVSSALVSLGESYDGHPSWNPDGTKIVYDYDYDIYAMNADGSGVTNVTNTTFNNDFGPSWSPDGQLIAYSGKYDGDYDIYTIKPDGTGKSAALTVNGVVDQEPDWSPDGTQLVFLTDRDTNYEIYIMDVDGSNQVNLSGSAGSDEGSPSWSTDGSRIAYVKGGDIYVRNADGSGTETNITNDSSTDQDPSW